MYYVTDNTYMTFSDQVNPEVERLVTEQRSADAHEWNDFVMKALFAHFSKLEQSYSRLYSLVDQVEGFDPQTAAQVLPEVNYALLRAGEVVLRFAPERATGTPEQVFRASRAACVLSEENDLADFDAQWDVVRTGIAVLKERAAFLEQLVAEREAARAANAAQASSTLPPVPGSTLPPPPRPAS